MPVRSAAPYSHGMPRPSRPVPEPLDVDSTTVIVAGTVLWFGALAVLLFTSDLGDDGDARWVWTCLAGGVLGLLGLALSLRQRRPRVVPDGAVPDGAVRDGAARDGAGG